MAVLEFPKEALIMVGFAETSHYVLRSGLPLTLHALVEGDAHRSESAANLDEAIHATVKE